MEEKEIGQGHRSASAGAENWTHSGIDARYSGQEEEAGET